MAATMVLLCLAAPALADTNAADRTAARALFEQARKLAADGKASQACPKFEESQRLDPGMGTLFNLADCYEQTGRTATAWSTFLEVASQAKVAGQKDKEKVARERAESLAPKLSKLIIDVPAASDVPGLEVKRDGSLVGKPLWSGEVPVDPGEHTIEATAPGKEKFSSKVQIHGNAESARVSIPTLQDAAASPSSDKAPAPVVLGATSGDDESSHRGSTQRIVGIAVGAVGLIGAGVATYVTFSAKSKLSDADAYCNGNACWDQKGVDLHHDAVSQGKVATVIGGIGAAALIGGLVLYLTAPSARSPATRAQSASPALAFGPSGVFLKGAW